MGNFSEQHFYDYLADLRNKYGRLSTYFQLKERVENDPDCPEGIRKMFYKCEQSILEDNERYTELLKTDPRDWEDDR